MDGSLITLLIVGVVAVLCNVGAAMHKSGAAMLALPLQAAVLWFGYQWNGVWGLVIAFFVVNAVSIIISKRLLGK